MANRTDKEAGTVHGTDPQVRKKRKKRDHLDGSRSFSLLSPPSTMRSLTRPPSLSPPPPNGKKKQNLVEKILRTRIYDTVYWKQHCFGLTAASLLDQASQLRSVGGGGGSAVSGGAGPPSRFICLVLKLLQLQPDREVVLEYINQEGSKYVRLLGAFYLRLTARPADVYRDLEPLLMDKRRVRARVSASASSAVGVSTGASNATYALTHVDELVDAMLCTPYLFDVALPRLPPRATLQAAGALPAGVPRESSLRGEFERSWEAERPERERERARRRRAEEGEEEDEEERTRRERRSGAPDGEDGELEEGARGDEGRDSRRRERWRLSPPRGGGGRRRGRSRSRSRDRGGDCDRDRGGGRGSSHNRRRDDGDRGDGNGGREGYYRRRSRSRDRGDDDRGKRPRRGEEEGELGGGGGGGGGGKKDGLSVAETNALRDTLGLAPLR